jgi:hypothetical protein
MTSPWQATPTERQASVGSGTLYPRSPYHSDMALIHGRIDRVDSRINRIERRLELQDDVR